jgi:PAS domain S-box-containing protein
MNTADEANLLHAIINNLPDHLYVKDLQSRFVLVSNAHLQRFGCSAMEEIVGKTDFDFFTAEHAAPAYADEQQLVAGSLPVITREEKETWQDGSVTWVSTTKLPLKDSAGQIIGKVRLPQPVKRPRRQTVARVNFLPT